MGPPDFRRFGSGWGRRSRRGDVRAAVVVLLEEGPRNGYQLIQEIETRSNGVWRPSPGSIYPVLSQLEDEGLIEMTESSSGRVFQLTAAGRAALEERRSAFGKPWEDAAAEGSEPRFALMRATKQVIVAVRSLREAGTDAQVEAATEALNEARRKIYQLLAEEPAS
jgi:DNA-binding PadR family transcriptional regulator